MFVTHKRYKCFKKQRHIDTCVSAFRELERFGFEFGDFGFAWDPCSFSGEHTETLLGWDSRESCLNPEALGGCLKNVLGFRKRYPCGGFWSGYEYHVSIGLMSLKESTLYLRDQQRRHNLVVVGQQQLPCWESAERGCGNAQWGLPRKRRRNRDYKGRALISLNIICKMLLPFISFFIQMQGEDHFVIILSSIFLLYS